MRSTKERCSNQYNEKKLDNQPEIENANEMEAFVQHSVRRSYQSVAQLTSLATSAYFPLCLSVVTASLCVLPVKAGGPRPAIFIFDADAGKNGFSSPRIVCVGAEGCLPLLPHLKRNHNHRQHQHSHC